MEDIKNVLSDYAPRGYSYNRHAQFAYPYLMVTGVARVQKVPDKDMMRLYKLICRAIQSGLTKKEQLFAFCGISEHDEFMLKELRMLVKNDILADAEDEFELTLWGEEFIKNDKILVSDEKEEYSFYVDATTGKIVPNVTLIDKNLKNVRPNGRIRDIVNHLVSSNDLSEIRTSYTASHSNGAVMLGFVKSQEAYRWSEYILVEYTSNDLEGNPIYRVYDPDMRQEVKYISRLMNENLLDQTMYLLG
ncbi:MAG: hypothetical protein MJZ76_07725 [Bacteroidales bacterium]|nr:hypothetical protein [Bacteroidales bacterium]